MDWIRNLLNWREYHDNIGLDLIRVFLGVALFIRGYLFVTNQEVLYDFIDAQGLLVAGMMIHYITLAHLYGGFILAFGLLTRVSALAQVPILASAVFLVHLEEGLFSSGQSFELSMLVLFLLLVICVFGPGKLSLDYYFFGRVTEAPARVILDTTQRDLEDEQRAIVIDHARKRAEREHAPGHIAPVALSTPSLATEEVPVTSLFMDDEESGIKLKTSAKYVAVFFFGFVLFFSMILMENVPIGFSFEELAVVGGVTLLIFGLFFFFYRSAFAEGDDDSNYAYADEVKPSTQAAPTESEEPATA